MRSLVGKWSHLTHLLHILFSDGCTINMLSLIQFFWSCSLTRESFLLAMYTPWWHSSVCILATTHKSHLIRHWPVWQIHSVRKLHSSLVKPAVQIHENVCVCVCASLRDNPLVLLVIEQSYINRWWDSFHLQITDPVLSSAAHALTLLAEYPKHIPKNTVYKPLLISAKNEKQPAHTGPSERKITSLAQFCRTKCFLMCPMIDTYIYISVLFLNY